jgi:hypothetical protein
MKRKLIIVALAVLVSMNMCWIGKDLYWEYGDFKPVIAHSITLATDQVCRGSNLYYTVDIDKTMNVSCVITRELVNSYRINYDPVYPTSGELGKRPVTSRVYIPKNTEPDEWFLRWRQTCFVGPKKREIITNLESKPFRVNDCEGKK